MVWCDDVAQATPGYTPGVSEPLSPKPVQSPVDKAPRYEFSRAASEVSSPAKQTRAVQPEFDPDDVPEPADEINDDDDVRAWFVVPALTAAGR